MQAVKVHITLTSLCACVSVTTRTKGANRTPTSHALNSTPKSIAVYMCILQTELSPLVWQRNQNTRNRAALVISGTHKFTLWPLTLWFTSCLNHFLRKTDRLLNPASHVLSGVINACISIKVSLPCNAFVNITFLLFLKLKRVLLCWYQHAHFCLCWRMLLSSPLTLCNLCWEQLEISRHYISF